MAVKRSICAECGLDGWNWKCHECGCLSGIRQGSPAYGPAVNARAARMKMKAEGTFETSLSAGDSKTADTGTEPSGTFKARGHSGTLLFDGAFITISVDQHQKSMAVPMGEKRIPLSAVSAVQWKSPSGLVAGFIAFTVPGGNERTSKLGSSTTNAVKDENSVVFRKDVEDKFTALRNAIETAISERETSPTTAPAPAAAAPSSLADELKKFAELRDSGILTEAEFEQQKAKLLEGD